MRNMSVDNGLVSIICPCFNSERFIQRMLDSVRNQTYKNLEIICVDDGSEDSTINIVESNVSLFENEGMRLICKKKAHGGQAAAVNYALKWIKGEYFTLIDSDDFYTPESVQKRVEALEENQDCSVAVSDYFIVNENDITTIIEKGNDYCHNFAFQPRQFFLLLSGLSPVTPIGYMIRTEDMRRINPQMEINECVEGQNYQILLPLYYYYKRVFVDEPLAYYVVRSNSHDHMERTRNELKERGANLINMVREVMTEMGLNEREINRYILMSKFPSIIEDA